MSEKLLSRVIRGTSTNQDHVCDLNDLKILSDTKSCISFATPIFKQLQLAVRDKNLTDKAALLWIYLCEKAYFSKDWSLRKSIRKIAQEFGWSKNTAHEALKCLESNHMIVIERTNRSVTKNEANLLKLRFSQSGIDVANLETDSATAKYLDTVGQNKNSAPKAGEGREARDISLKNFYKKGC